MIKFLEYIFVLLQSKFIFLDWAHFDKFFVTLRFKINVDLIMPLKMLLQFQKACIFFQAFEVEISILAS